MLFIISIKIQKSVMLVYMLGYTLITVPSCPPTRGRCWHGVQDHRLGGERPGSHHHGQGVPAETQGGDEPAAQGLRREPGQGRQGLPEGSMASIHHSPAVYEWAYSSIAPRDVDASACLMVNCWFSAVSTGGGRRRDGHRHQTGGG